MDDEKSMSVVDPTAFAAALALERNGKEKVRGGMSAGWKPYVSADCRHQKSVATSRPPRRTKGILIDGGCSWKSCLGPPSLTKVFSDSGSSTRNIPPVEIMELLTRAAGVSTLKQLCKLP